MIGVEADLDLSSTLGQLLHREKNGPPVEEYNDDFFKIVDWATFCWLILEMYVNTRQDGLRSFYRGPDWRWNLFDAAVLILAAVDLLLSLLQFTGVVSLSFLRI